MALEILKRTRDVPLNLSFYARIFKNLKIEIEWDYKLSQFFLYFNLKLNLRAPGNSFLVSLWSLKVVST